MSQEEVVRTYRYIYKSKRKKTKETVMLMVRLEFLSLSRLLSGNGFWFVHSVPVRSEIHTHTHTQHSRFYMYIIRIINADSKDIVRKRKKRCGEACLTYTYI